MVLKLIGRLRSDDLYSLLPHYPEPQERSTALSSQAAMLYVLLYFSPDILKQETALMREIVDKYFCDNWVISVYMGTTVWLPEAWEQYKAARAAITNTTANNEVKKIAVNQGNQLRVLIPKLQHLLTEGTITQEVLLDSITKVIRIDPVIVNDTVCFLDHKCDQGRQCQSEMAISSHCITSNIG